MILKAYGDSEGLARLSLMRVLGLLLGLGFISCTLNRTKP